MKPSISIDERGVLLHMTDAEGKGFAVALNAETLAALSAQIAVALERVKSPETRAPVLWAAATAALRELVGNPEKKADGTSEPDPTRTKDR